MPRSESRSPGTPSAEEGPVDTLRQIPVSEWQPENRPIAMVRLEPADFEARFGLQFDDTHDDLDYLKIAVVEFPSGHQMGLLRHKRNPVPGTVVHAGVTLDAESARNEFLHMLGLAEADFTWRPEQER
jgi:hypothetical protein